MATLGEILPNFCAELQGLIRSCGREDLVEQVPDLPLVARCRCGSRDCALFYTAEPPGGAYGAGHSNVVLSPDTGIVVLDLMHDTIVKVEVLDRPDVTVPLDAALPRETPQYQSCLPCAACGFLTIRDSTYGSDETCDVCDWQDDGVQLANPACGRGANHRSLIEAQAANLTRFPLTLAEVDGIPRSPTWRPLNASEAALAIAQREQKYWMNPAIEEVAACYWSKG